MATIGDILNKALQAFQSGQFDQTRTLCRQVLKQMPNQPDTLQLIGLAEHQLGRHAKGADYLEKAIRYKKNDPQLHMNAAIVQAAAGKTPKAIRNYEKTIQLAPSMFEARNNLGNLYWKSGDATKAREHLEQVVQMAPNYAPARINLANALKSDGELEQAIEEYRTAFRLDPNDAAAANNLGNTYLVVGDSEQAVEWLETAIRLAPEDPSHHANLGKAKLHRREFEAAEACFTRALEQCPDDAEIHRDLGNAYLQANEPDKAEASFMRAIELDRKYADAYIDLGNVYLSTGLVGQAVERYRQAVRLDKTLSVAGSNLACALNYDPDADLDLVFEAHRTWAKLQTKKIKPFDSFDVDRNPDRKLRIGYISPDFRQHAVSSFFEPVISNHDHDRFEIICYSNVNTPDEVTERFKSYADRWVDISRYKDEFIAGMIHDDQIDLLVDLSGHTSNHRLLVLAHRPAPVQIAYLGYPNTTGLDSVDYRLTDAVADPESDPTPHTETLIRLPKGIACYSPNEDVPPISELPARHNGFVTFGSLNNLSKINARVVELWASVLRAVPDSRLLMFRDRLTGTVRDRFISQFVQAGIDPARLDLESELPDGESHHSIFNRIDVILDTFPWNGHTITCEALGMGIPVVTLAGRSNAGRLAATTLHHVGLADKLVATDAEDFVSKAAALIQDFDQLAQLRQGMRDRMRESPLCDAIGFTRSLEDTYRSLWADWCK